MEEDLVNGLRRRLAGVVEPETETRGPHSKEIVKLLDRPRGVAGLFARRVACSDDVGRRQKHHDVQRPAADELDTLREEWSRNHTLEDDSEALCEIVVCRVNREPVPESQLAFGLRLRGRKRILSAGHDAAAEDVTLEMNAARESLREQSRNGRLPCSGRT
jgi:hypothetical protein